MKLFLIRVPFSSVDGRAVKHEIILCAGKMKTYWLSRRLNRSPATRSIKPADDDEELEKKDSLLSPDLPCPSAERIHQQIEKSKPLYSPITLREVRARSSISEVPMNSNLNKIKGIFYLLCQLAVEIVNKRPMFCVLQRTVLARWVPRR